MSIADCFPKKPSINSYFHKQYSRFFPESMPKIGILSLYFWQSDGYKYLTVALIRLTAFWYFAFNWLFFSITPTSIGLIAFLLLIYKACLYTKDIKHSPMTYVVNIFSSMVPFSNKILNFEYLDTSILFFFF